MPAAHARVKKAITTWFATRRWKPFAFQREVWKAIADGRSGLLHATTGAGKTYAVWLGALMAFAAAATTKPPPLTVLWITPMRALAADTLRALQLPLDALSADGLLAWTAGARSGDTSSGERAAQNQRLPTVLVTTPESLSVLLSRADAKDVLGTVRLVVVDEWHELLGNKRGVQVQLALDERDQRLAHRATQIEVLARRCRAHQHAQLHAALGGVGHLHDADALVPVG